MSKTRMIGLLMVSLFIGFCGSNAFSQKVPYPRFEDNILKSFENLSTKEKKEIHAALTSVDYKWGGGIRIRSLLNAIIAGGDAYSDEATKMKNAMELVKLLKIFVEKDPDLICFRDRFGKNLMHHIAATVTCAPKDKIPVLLELLDYVRNIDGENNTFDSTEVGSSTPRGVLVSYLERLKRTFHDPDIPKIIADYLDKG